MKVVVGLCNIVVWIIFDMAILPVWLESGGVDTGLVSGIIFIGLMLGVVFGMFLIEREYTGGTSG